MSRCTRAEREHSQAANPSWPTEIFHTIDTKLSIQMGIGWGAGICGFCDRCSGTGCAVTKTVLFIACFSDSLLLLLFLLCCLIKLPSSQPMSFTFWPVFSPSHFGGEGASGCLVLADGYWVKPHLVGLFIYSYKLLYITLILKKVVKKSRYIHLWHYPRPCSWQEGLN